MFLSHMNDFSTVLLMGTNTPDQSRPGSNGNKEVY